jgi:hypothetical protein
MTVAESSRAALQCELTALLTAFWYEVDHNDGRAAAGYFTPDARLRFEDALFEGTEAIDSVYKTRAARGARVSRHLVTNVHLLEVGDDRVSSRWIRNLFLGSPSDLAVPVE